MPADEVDHIQPLTDESDKQHLTDQNGLAPLCKSHHAKKTAEVDPHPAEMERYRQIINEAKRKYDYENATDATC